MARRLMTRNIYHSQKKLAIEYSLIRLLVSLSESLEDHAAYADIRQTRLGKFLQNANAFNQTVKSSDNVEKHKHAFLTENRKLCHL